jgi:excisionase family DNA binding protein
VDDQVVVSPAVLKVARALVASGFDAGPDEPQEDAERPVYRVQEAAALLKVHESTLYRAIQRGALGAYSIGAAGRAIRIPADEFDAFRARRMIRALAVA